MAERELTASVLSAIAAGTVRPVFFFEGVYESGGADAYLRIFTGTGQIEWDGETWTGGRDLLQISPIRESTHVQAIGFSVTISGLPADKLAIALGSMRQNKPGRLWLGFFDSAGALIADPFPLRRGRFDFAPINRAGEEMTIEARYEDRLVDLERPRERRYTTIDQQLRSPTDRGFDQVPELQESQDVWGAPPQ